MVSSLKGGNRIMLVLTRRNGEEIVIAGDIRVTVVAVKGNRVRLGIAAPSSVAVAREELLTECSGDGDGTTVSCPAPPILGGTERPWRRRGGASWAEKSRQTCRVGGRPTRLIDGGETAAARQNSRGFPCSTSCAPFGGAKRLP